MISDRLSTEQGGESSTTETQNSNSICQALHHVSKILGDRLSRLARSQSVMDQYEALTAAVYLLSSAANTSFISRDSRRRSFEQNDAWSRRGGTQSVEDLVESGFFYLGEADHVKCFFCDLRLKDWEAGDRPDMEHAKFSPLCFFLKSSRGLDWLRRSSPRPPNYPTSYSRQDHNRLLENLASKFKEFLDLSSRLGYCPNKILLCLARDYIRRRKWLEVKELIHELRIDSETPIFNSNFDLAASLRSLCPRIFLAERPTENRQELSSGSRRCVSCRVQDREIVFLPCGHFFFCRLCSIRLPICPIADCKVRIFDKWRAFIA